MKEFMEEKNSYLGNEQFECIMRKNYEIYTLGAALILGTDLRTDMVTLTTGWQSSPWIHDRRNVCDWT